MDKRLHLDNLRSAMERNGLNAAQLAQRLDVSREAVSKWLNGQSVPRPDKLLKLALILSLGFDELVERANAETEPVIAFRKRGASKTTEQHIARAQEMGRLMNRLKTIAEDAVISPVSVYLEMNRYARHSQQPEIDLGQSIYGAAKNLSKGYKMLSEGLFEGAHPSPSVYIERVVEVFETPFFDTLREFLRQRDTGPG